MNVEEYKQDVLDDINNCISPCADIQSVCLTRGVNHDTDWLIAHLPKLNYTKNRMLNYMFSNGLAAGSEEDNARLDDWLYETKGQMGATNYDVLQNAIGEAAVYGECGLRIVDGRLFTYHKGHYAVVYHQDNGITEIDAYFIREDEGLITEDIEIHEWSLFESVEDVLNWFKEHKLILLDPSEFVNLRNDTSKMHGMSPFSVDKMRIELLLSIYTRLNYDINYDGPGRIIVRPRAGFASDEDNETSTSTIIENNNEEAQRRKYNDAMREVRRVSSEIKNSSSDAVIALSNGFSDKIEHLPRVTKATEFFGWLDDNEGVMIAELLGMSPVLMEVGKWSGNVSMSAIIDNSMLNTIVPMREKYAIQFSKMLSEYLGIKKVYFNKYDMKQIEDEQAARSRLAVAIRDLCYASKSLVADEASEDAKRTSTALNGLIVQLGDMLGTSLYDEYGNPKTL